MKKPFSLFLIFLICLLNNFNSFAQTCCSADANAVFARLANDKKFVSSHESPLPFTFKGQKGKMATFKTSTGADGRAYVVQAPSDQYLFVFHEWWGLNDYIKQETERLAKELKINVFAIDLYDGKVTDNPEEAAKLTKSVKKERAEAIIKGAFVSVGKQVEISTIGWCFGGGWALQAAIIAGKQAVACVMYYGMPETDTNKLKKLNAEVLGIFASRDEWINTDVVKAFEDNMLKAGKSLAVKTFDADHAFANPSNPKFNKEAAEEANKLAIQFLKKGAH